LEDRDQVGSEEDIGTTFLDGVEELAEKIASLCFVGDVIIVYQS
jgi:hypothetical protein